MKKLVQWLEEKDKRTRKVLALFTAAVWVLSVIGSYILANFGHDTIAVLSLVTAQFAAVMSVYMISDASRD